MNNNNNPIPEKNEELPEKAIPQKSPSEIEPIETDKTERDLPAEAYPTSTESFSQFFQPQTPYEKYLNDPEEKWE